MMTKVKLSIVLPNLCGGGAERLHVNLANDWVVKGYEVEFILLRKEGELIPLLAPEIKVIGLNVYRFRNAILPLAGYLRKSSPQVVLVAMWPLTSAGVLAWLLSGRKGKLFLSEHENLSASYIAQGRVKLRYLKYVIRFSYFFADGVIAVSQGVKNDLCQIGNLKDSLVRVIHNPAAIGIPSVVSTSPEQKELWGGDFDYHILSVGRLAPQKDHKNLIEAFSFFVKSHNAILVILGEGPLRSELEALIKKLKLEDNIFLHGFVLDPYPWFRSADLFVLSSRWEGFGNVLVEALECGVPVVSTDCPSGPAEILEYGRYGKLVPVQDPNALASSIALSLTGKHDRVALMGRAKDFSLGKIADEYLKYFFCKRILNEFA